MHSERQGSFDATTQVLAGDIKRSISDVHRWLLRWYDEHCARERNCLSAQKLYVGSLLASVWLGRPRERGIPMPASLS